MYNKLTYLYYGCYFESVGDNQISIHSDYMKIVEDPDLIKSDIIAPQLLNHSDGTPVRNIKILTPEESELLNN